MGAVLQLRGSKTYMENDVKTAKASVLEVIKNIKTRLVWGGDE